MRPVCTLMVVALAARSALLLAQEAGPAAIAAGQDRGVAEERSADDAWVRTLTDRSRRDALHDATQLVRGDSGKWNDEHRLQLAPPVARKPANVSLDDWADRLLETGFTVSDRDDHWLLFRTRQLDDNDRVWVERIERRGNQLTVIVHEAVWQGRYQKNFTCYSAIGLNLGRLEPGKYEAKLIVRPLVFGAFEQIGAARGNWPKDERPADRKPAELSVSFTVSEVKP